MARGAGGSIYRLPRVARRPMSAASQALAILEATFAALEIGKVGVGRSSQACRHRESGEDHDCDGKSGFRKMPEGPEHRDPGQRQGRKKCSDFPSVGRFFGHLSYPVDSSSQLIGCYTGSRAPRPYRKNPYSVSCFTGRDQPSMDSRRQCRAVKIISTNAMLKDAAADTHTSSTSMGSSLSTLVISKCWLRDGMNISELLVFKE